MIGCISSSPSSPRQADTRVDSNGPEQREVSTVETVGRIVEQSRRTMGSIPLFTRVETAMGPAANFVDSINFTITHSRLDNGGFRIDAFFKAPISGRYLSRTMEGGTEAEVDRKLAEMRLEFLQSLPCCMEENKSWDTEPRAR